MASANKTYEVRTRFSLNLGDGAKSLSLNVAPGEKLQFDGVTVSIRGVSGIAPTMVAVIRLGWVREVASDVSDTAGTESAKQEESPSSVFTPQSQPSTQATSTSTTRRTVSSEEYGREVQSSRIARAGQASSNNSSVITSSTSAQQRRAVVPHEAQVRVASSSQQATPREVQYIQPATRPRRAVEVYDHDEVQTGVARSRATSTQNANLLTGSDSTGVDDSEIGLSGRSGRKSTISRGPVEKQEVSGVIKGRRATPLSFSDDMTKVSASQASSDPAPIHSGDDMVVGSVRKTEATTSNGGEMTVTTQVSAQGDIVVPAATTSAQGPDIIISKVAAVTSPEDDLYDPANYLDLAEAPKQPPVTRIVESSSPETADQIEFGTEDTLGAERTMLDHEGKEVKVTSKGTTVLGDTDAAAAAEEDYSNLNDGLEKSQQPVDALPSDAVVPADYLDTLKVGGMLWAKSPHTAKIAYIKGKKSGKGYTGGCTNLSVLRLISAQSGLPKSVLDAAAERVAELRG